MDIEWYELKKWRSSLCTFTSESKGREAIMNSFRESHLFHCMNFPWVLPIFSFSSSCKSCLVDDERGLSLRRVICKIVLILLWRSSSPKNDYCQGFWCQAWSEKRSRRTRLVFRFFSMSIFLRYLYFSGISSFQVEIIMRGKPMIIKPTNF